MAADFGPPPFFLSLVGRISAATPHVIRHEPVCTTITPGDAPPAAHTRACSNLPCAPSVAATGIANSGATGAGFRRGTTTLAAAWASTYCAARPPTDPGPSSLPNRVPTPCPLYSPPR